MDIVSSLPPLSLAIASTFPFQDHITMPVGLEFGLFTNEDDGSMVGNTIIGNASMQCCRNEFNRIFTLEIVDAAMLIEYTVRR